MFLRTDGDKVPLARIEVVPRIQQEVTMDIKKYNKIVESLQTYQHQMIGYRGVVFGLSISMTSIHLRIAVGHQLFVRQLYRNAAFFEGTKMLQLMEDFLARTLPEAVTAIIVDEVLCNNHNCPQRKMCKRHKLYEDLLIGKLSQNNQVEHFHKKDGKDCKFFIQIDKK